MILTPVLASQNHIWQLNPNLNEYSKNSFCFTVYKSMGVAAASISAAPMLSLTVHRKDGGGKGNNNNA